MKTHTCCGQQLTGKPIGMRSYFCDKCQTEHLVEARDIEELLVNLYNRIEELERLNAVAPLPSLF